MICLLNLNLSSVLQNLSTHISLLVCILMGCNLFSCVKATTVHRRDLPEAKWERFGGSAYLFAIDAHREVDTTRAAAGVICRSMGATLVAINSDEEMTFLQERIRTLVEEQGQQFAQEQWWTGGKRKDGDWVWEAVHEERPVTFTVETDGVPVHQTDVTHYVVLEHVPSEWKLHTLPENYQLRYICEKDDPNRLYPVIYPTADTSQDGNARPIEERMLAMLFREYDPDARGNRRSDVAVTVNLQFVLLRIQELDEKNMVLTSRGLIVAEWRDERLSWNPVEYDNVTTVIVKAERLWLPELALINGAEETIVEDFEKIRAVVNHDGRVHWEPGGNFRTTCDINIYYFPFDYQVCEIVIGAWAYDSAKMNVTNISTSVNINNFTLNGEWELLETHVKWGEAELECCPGMSYSHVRFQLEMRRRHLFYVVNIIAPCVVLSALVLVVFWVPPDAGERLSAGISVLLAFIVFLIMIADAVPRTSLHVPVLIIYLTCIMCLVAVSIGWTVLIINLHFRCNRKPLPVWTRRFLAFQRGKKQKAKLSPDTLTTTTTYHAYDKGASSNIVYGPETGNDVMSCEKLRVIKDVKVGATLGRKPAVSFKEPLTETHVTSDPRLMTSETHVTSDHHMTSDMHEAALRVPLKRDSAPPRDVIQHENEAAVRLEEGKQIVAIMDKLFFVCMLLAMGLSSVFILIIPWYAPPVH